MRPKEEGRAGTSCCARAESTGSLIRRRTRYGPPAVRSISYSMPHGPFPLGDQRLVALNGPAFGFVVAPTQVMKQSPDMIATVLNAEAARGEFRNALSRPQFRRISMRHDALEQIADQALFGTGGHLTRSTKGRLWLQRVRTRASHGPLPSQHESLSSLMRRHCSAAKWSSTTTSSARRNSVALLSRVTTSPMEVMACGGRAFGSEAQARRGRERSRTARPSSSPPQAEAVPVPGSRCLRGPSVRGTTSRASASLRRTRRTRSWELLRSA